MSNSKQEVHSPIQINSQTCIRCDFCDWVCPGDLIHHEDGNKEQLPVIVYPDECWFCGLCQKICPADAITIIFPDRMINNKTDVITLLGKVIESPTPVGPADDRLSK